MTPPRAMAGAVLGVVATGCVYLNSLYNARQRYDDGERARMEGRVVDAREAYDDAIRKAAASFRKSPEGSWADDALYLLGRAYLRHGDYARALGALDEALARTDDPAVRDGARLYLGAASTQVGDRIRARELLDLAVQDLEGHELQGEAFYWRGRLSLGEEQLGQALFDLARAEQVDPRLHVPVQFQRLAYGIAVDDTALAVRSATALLATASAGVQVDSIAALVGRAAHEWGAFAAATLLAPTRTSDWPPRARDRLMLQRITLLAEAGDTLAVESEAGWAAQGTTPGAEAARLIMARIRLSRIEEVTALDAVRDVLRPAGGNPEVAALAADIRRVEVLDEWGASGEPVAWFVAAEVARDRLGAARLARGLFLRFASEAPDNPWAGKAVLAALATTPDVRSDPALRDGLEMRADDPYVAGARAERGVEASLNTLEMRLGRIVDDLLARADSEALRRDLFLRGADTAVVGESGRS